jgi:hypothetical protein
LIASFVTTTRVADLVIPTVFCGIEQHLARR